MYTQTTRVRGPTQSRYTALDDFCFLKIDAKIDNHDDDPDGDTNHDDDPD